MAWTVPRVRGLEHAGRGARGAAIGRRRDGARGARCPSITPRVLAEVSAPAVAASAPASPEFDRVLGGGLVPGSLVLLGG